MSIQTSALHPQPRERSEESPAQILVVEDENDIAALVAYHLMREGYRVRTLAAGKQALEQVGRERPDLVLLDLMLPVFSGFEVLAELRGQPETADLPVVILTARDDEADRIRGLELGADDYITKPFSPKELLLRVQAVLRRTRAPATGGRGPILRGGPVTVDAGAVQVSVDGEEITLTPIEYRLLVALLESRGRVQDRGRLLEIVWKARGDLETRTVDMHVQRLRSKLGAAGGWIETVRGFGYRFRADDVRPGS
ncbi:MAG: response regulator transcription factor [Gemmatimonadales bacterium]